MKIKKLLNLKNISEKCIQNSDYSIDIHYDSEYLKYYEKLQSMVNKKLVCGIVSGVIGWRNNADEIGLSSVLYSYNNNGDIFIPIQIGVIPMQCEPNRIQLTIDFTDVDIDIIKSDMKSDNMTIMLFEVTDEYKIIKGLGTICLPIVTELLTFRYDSKMQLEVIKHMNIVVCDENYINDKKAMIKYAAEKFDFNDMSSVIKCKNKKLGYIALNSIKYNPLLTVNASPLDNQKIEDINDYINVLNTDSVYIKDNECVISVIIGKSYVDRYLDIKYIALVLIDQEGNIELIKDSINKLPSYGSVCSYCLEA